MAAIVPTGFERYLRIDHGPPDASDGWGLPPEVLEGIVGRGAAATSTPNRALLAVWEGYGWDSATVTFAARRKGLRARFGRQDPFADAVAGFDRRKAELADELATLPKLVAPMRSYYLLTGPLAAVPGVQDPVSPPARRPPDLWWPADRAWFVGSDTDLTWTYVAGSAPFVEALADRWPDQTRLVAATEPVE